MTATSNFPVVFSDLDGTLLDDDYHFDAAEDVLARIRACSIPLVLTSSKTHAEMIRLREELAPGMPLIFENGCGISVPPGFFPDAPGDPGDREVIERFGHDYAEIRSIITVLRREQGFDFRGFGDMSDAEVAERTGLPLGDAARARMREASEPGLLEGGDAELARLGAALAPHELRLVRGGRFLHLMPRADKVIAMMALTARFRARHPDADLVTIAAGDSDNDADMLRAADHAIVVRRSDGSWLELPDGVRAQRSDATGPAGWAQCMHGLLDDLGLPRAAPEAEADAVTEAMVSDEACP